VRISACFGVQDQTVEVEDQCVNHAPHYTRPLLIQLRFGLSLFGMKNTSLAPGASEVKLSLIFSLMVNICLQESLNPQTAA